MIVVATAGHVDHGKSTLVRALTGMEPDRWAEERRRGLTIDLGFAWTALASGREVAFVDVPGHERFLTNMLAGLGPSPVVLFVVAADEGWMPQTQDHRDALAAWGVEHGVVVLSRCDRATPEQLDAVERQVREGLDGTGLADAPLVWVAAADPADAARAREVVGETLDAVLATVPAGPEGGRLRLWVDRSFTVKGVGTVVTGTLQEGALAVGDRLEVHRTTSGGTRPVAVRGLQTRGLEVEQVGPVSRVAVNLRGVAAGDVRRGDALVRSDEWTIGHEIDARRVSGEPWDRIPGRLHAHLGTASAPVRVRDFDDTHARLTFDGDLPLTPGDRIVLRLPGDRIVGGAQVLDVDPPALRRRGDGARRAKQLAQVPRDGVPDVAAEVARRGAVTRAALRRLGVLTDRSPRVPHGVVVLGEWWCDPAALDRWAVALAALVERTHAADPLAVGVPLPAATSELGLPDRALLAEVARRASVESADGQLHATGHHGALGGAEDAVNALVADLETSPFAAPGLTDLAERGLGAKELAAAARAGRLLRLPDDVVLLPSAPALAMRLLARLPQPFTTSQARVALETSRRVVVPLLEHLDARGWTRRLDGTRREVVR
ncbi:selenocysteine-specific translation elongation factor [Nocardioides sp. GXZ039]|uniref:selenocysteine-specific translation elongation factor n=1 Tax=Nocardioides sp. GXZ039 TaxID=3136018 RepID=UPI0030F3DCAC